MPKKCLCHCKKVFANSVHAHYNRAINTKPQITFALAGELVSDAAHAKRILVDAIHKDKDKDWLVPQAESVFRQLRAQAPKAA